MGGWLRNMSANVSCFLSEFYTKARFSSPYLGEGLDHCSTPDSAQLVKE